MVDRTARIHDPTSQAPRAVRNMTAIFDPTLQFLRRYWPSLATAAAVGAFLAFAGAFGTDAVPAPTRLLYWVPMIVVGTVAGIAVWSHTARRPRIGEKPGLIWAVTTAVIAVPGTLFVWGYTLALLGRPPRSSLLLFIEVAVISGAMTAIMMLINRPGPATREAPPDARTPPPAVRFLERLPAKLKGATLYAVEAEDHYLRLHTSKGSDLILMRIADAVAELDGIEGAQVHRSWWVARAAVETVRRDGRRVALVLKNGAEAPVSRPNVAALRESGWI
jgi:hypothetical protein